MKLRSSPTVRSPTRAACAAALPPSEAPFAPRGGPSALTPGRSRRTPRGLALRGNGFHFLQRVAEIGHVLERPVDRREPDVRDLVELVELFHHHLAELARWYLTLAKRQHAMDDAVDRRVDELGGHRSLVQRAREAYAQPRRVEFGAIAVGLDDLRQPQLDCLVCREAFLAAGAAAAAADGVARLGYAR